MAILPRASPNICAMSIPVSNSWSCALIKGRFYHVSTKDRELIFTFISIKKGNTVLRIMCLFLQKHDLESKGGFVISLLSFWCLSRKATLFISHHLKYYSLTNKYSKTSETTRWVSYSAFHFCASPCRVWWYADLHKSWNVAQKKKSYRKSQLTAFL